MPRSAEGAPEIVDMIYLYSYETRYETHYMALSLYIDALLENDALIVRLNAAEGTITEAIQGSEYKRVFADTARALADTGALEAVCALPAAEPYSVRPAVALPESLSSLAEYPDFSFDPFTGEWTIRGEYISVYSNGSFMVSLSYSGTAENVKVPVLTVGFVDTETGENVYEILSAAFTFNGETYTVSNLSEGKSGYSATLAGDTADALLSALAVAESVDVSLKIPGGSLRQSISLGSSIMLSFVAGIISEI